MGQSENLLGYSFIITGKVGRGRRPSLTFLSRHHSSIISSSSRLSKFPRPLPQVSLHGQARSTNDCFVFFNVCREHVPWIIISHGSMGWMWGSCHHCFLVGGRSPASVAKQTCFLESSTYKGLPFCLYLQSPGGLTIQSPPWSLHPVTALKYRRQDWVTRRPFLEACPLLFPCRRRFGAPPIGGGQTEGHACESPPFPALLAPPPGAHPSLCVFPGPPRGMPMGVF